MTRTHTNHPVWTWKCDSCGAEQYLSREQSGPNGLPTPDQMRAKGWLAERYGDRCPTCNDAQPPIESEQA